MAEYTVIWRGDGDDYMSTVVNTDADPTNTTSTMWVTMAAEIEFKGWDAAARVDAMLSLVDFGFDLIGVFKGRLEPAH
jgi:hypothetical protein